MVDLAWAYLDFVAVSVGHDCCQAHPTALVTLAAADSVQACWQDWVSVAVSVVELSVERSDVAPEGWSKPREAVAESCWEVALVSRQIDPVVEDVALLEPEADLPGLQERRLDQLLDVEVHPAVVLKIDRMMVHDVVVSGAVGLVGLDAWKLGM